MAWWYYAQQGQQRGPVELPELQQLLSSGQVSGQELVWTEGMPQWQPAAQVPAVTPPGAAVPMPGVPQPVMPAVPYGGYSPYEGPSKHAGLALTSMILSLVSIAFGGLFLAIPGAICGHIALKGMRQTGDFRNQGFAQAGFWVGLIITLLWLLVIIGFLVIFVVAAASAAASHH
jgi:hypothetical protein